jgi:hypothetical protein
VGRVKVVALELGFVIYCCINFLVFFIMESMAILPEYLHKDELQYELEARGVSTVGLDVAALRSTFRKARHLKEDPVVIGNTHLLLDHEAVLAFCQDRLDQIKDLVENTDASRIPADFPRYLHRLRHLANRLGHLLQSADLEAELQSSAQQLDRVLSTLVAYVTTSLRAGDIVPAVPVFDPHGDLPVDVQGRPNLATVSATYPAADMSGAPGGHVDPVNSRVNFSSSTSHHASFASPRSHASFHATPFVFAKLPNPLQKLLEFPMLYDDIGVHQRADSALSPIMDRLASGEDIAGYSLAKGILRCKARFDGRPKIVVPQSLISSLFAFFHVSPVGGGHLGIRKTLYKIRQTFIWKGMDSDVAIRVKACKVCALSKPAQVQHFGMLSSEVATRPFEKLFIDFVGKFPRSRSGNTYALVCVDAFTKFVWISPVREASTATTIRVLGSIFSNFGVPETLVSDNATQFTSRQFRNMCFARGIRHVTTTPYYPQPSHAERFNRNLRAALIAYHHRDHSRWDENLGWLQFAFNSAHHDAHKSTPFSLMLAYTPNSPLSALWSINDLLPDDPQPGNIRQRWDAARKNLRASHERLRRRYDAHHGPHNFQLGAKVWLRNHPQSNAAQGVSAKLCPRFRGPFVISEFTSPVTVRLVDEYGQTNARAHVSQLKKV